MITLRLSDPLPELDLPNEAVLGPFESAWYESGWFYGDGEPIAEVFRETATDMMSMSGIFGHPSADAVFVPRTFHSHESNDPDYPGAGYARLTFEVST